MEKRAAELEAEVERWLSAAEAADAEEDRAFGRDKSGEELPKWVADKKKRVEKIRAAKAELEAAAKAAAAAKAKAQAEAEERRQAEGRKKPGRPAAPPSEEPDPKRRELHRSRSRIMKTRTASSRATMRRRRSTRRRGDRRPRPRREAERSTSLRRWPRHRSHLGRSHALSADAGYCSDANLAAMRNARSTPYRAGRASTPGKEKAARPRRRHARKIKAAGTPAPTA